MLYVGVVGHELLEATTPYNLFWPTGHVGSVGVAGALSACNLHYAPPWHRPGGIASPSVLHTNKCDKYITSVPVITLVSISMLGRKALASTKLPMGVSLLSQL